MNTLSLATPAGCMPDGRGGGAGALLSTLGIHVWTRLLEEGLFPQAEPGTLGARGRVVIVAVPVEDGRAVRAH